MDYYGAAMGKMRAAISSLAAIALLILAVSLSLPASTVAPFRGVPPCAIYELAGIFAEAVSPQQSKPDRDMGKVYDASMRGVTPPVVIYSPRPHKHPLSSKRSPGNSSRNEKIKDGVVLVEFIVDLSGEVRDIEIKKAPDPFFAKEAESVLRTWRFKPAKFKGKPVACRLIAEITFHKLH